MVNFLLDNSLSCLLVLVSFGVLMMSMLRHPRYRKEFAGKIDEFAKLYGILIHLAPEPQPLSVGYLFRDVLWSVLFIGIIVVGWNAGVDGSRQISTQTYVTVVIVWECIKLLANHYDAYRRLVHWLVAIHESAARRLRE